MKETNVNPSSPATKSRLFETVFTNIPIAVAVVSSQSEIVEFNESFQSLFQLADEEIVLPVMFHQLSGSFWQKKDVQEYLYALLEENGIHSENVFDWQHEDGSLKYIQVISQLLRGMPDSSAKLLLTFYDVTEVKQIEKSYNERIRHMMHELRNPLSNISLCVELLADSTKENNQEDSEMFLSKASASVQRMKQLINDLNVAKKV